MKDCQFRALLNLFMCADPWPSFNCDRDVILSLLEEEAKRYGYSDWVEAYHCFKGD